jgi:hypothetical protein
MTAATGEAYVDVARSSLPRPEPAVQDVDREVATRHPSGDSADELTPLSAIPEIPGQYTAATQAKAKWRFWLRPDGLRLCSMYPRERNSFQFDLYI